MQDFFNRPGNRIRTGLFQFLPGAEAPECTDREYTRIFGGLHIHPGVPDIQAVLRLDIRQFKQLGHQPAVGLAGIPLPLPMDG